MIPRLAILLLLAALTGCEPGHPRAELRDTFLLPSGMEVKCYTVKRENADTHYIYVVEGRLVVTDNHMEGKTQVTRVTINGVDYAPVLEDSTTPSYAQP